MTIKCRFCETNTHDDPGYKCDRVFLTLEEALLVMAKTYHNFVQGPLNTLIGCDYSLDEVKELLSNAEGIEITDPTGVARKMNHGIAVQVRKKQYFFETDEEKLQELEKEIACNEGMK